MQKLIHGAIVIILLTSSQLSMSAESSRLRKTITADEAIACHVSDYRMGDELLRMQLTALGPLTEYGVATLQRSPGGWMMRHGAPPGTSLTGLLSLAHDLPVPG